MCERVTQKRGVYEYVPDRENPLWLSASGQSLICLACLPCGCSSQFVFLLPLSHVSSGGKALLGPARSRVATPYEVTRTALRIKRIVNLHDVVSLNHFWTGM